MAQKEALQPLVEAMFAAATGAFSKLTGISATAGATGAEAGDSSIRVEPDAVATLTRIPSTGVTFVSRFVKADVGKVVELMLGTPAEESDGEMDAMQLSIVVETVAQIATAMGERLALETQTGPMGPTPRSSTTRAASRSRRLPRSRPRFRWATCRRASAWISTDRARQDRDPSASAPAPNRPPNRLPPPPRACRPAAAARRRAGLRATSNGGLRRPAGRVRAHVADADPRGRPARQPDLVHDAARDSAVLGQTELCCARWWRQPGSVFELDKLSTEPIDPT